MIEIRVYRGHICGQGIPFLLDTTIEMIISILYNHIYYRKEFILDE